MKFSACGASVIGPRHLDLGEPNQDALVLSGCEGGWVAAVADGLGSRPRSDLGARRACQVSRRVLRGLASEVSLRAALPRIHDLWLNEISPITPEDATTTILMARVARNGRVVAAQLGDGALIIRSRGEIHCITPGRTGFANQTWALDAIFRADRWVVAESALVQPGDGVVMMTDGVSDDVRDDSLPEFMDALYENALKRCRRRGRRWIERELRDWATPLHSDDKTLVSIFRIDP